MSNTSSTKPKTTLLTGANRGIGLALARHFKARGDDVIAVVRRSSPELDALGVRVETDAEVTDEASLARVASRLKGTPVDVLVANAGVLVGDSLASFTVEELRRQFDVNAIGALLTVRAFRPLLREGSKIALVTSRMGSIDDNTSGGYYGYRMSKAALNIAGKSLAVDLKPAGIAVAILHPGMVATEMTGQHGIEAEVSARGLVGRIDALTLESTGTFWHQDGTVLPW
jgi:NAD(P)-dependent dehydrogenase (short-subunit alcohol dehydrogenase family)